MKLNKYTLEKARIGDVFFMTIISDWEFIKISNTEYTERCINKYETDHYTVKLIEDVHNYHSECFSLKEELFEQDMKELLS